MGGFNSGVFKMTITKILLDLFNSDWRVRRTVAENTNCPIETLIELAKDSDWRIRQAVARHANCPIETLIELAKDSKLWVRQAVGENANFPTS